ncbi:MAG: hypothetical protein V7K69_27970 [Nostoc sp.]|uniref:hypothetical protein n=1 Tax=Nostoc sp. TaxID=1180 RepID=UPI002FFAFC3F
MENELTTLTYEIELKTGERLNIPESILESITTGRWIITIQQKAEESASTRSHDAFFNGYAPEDEGLYDNCPSR